MLIEDIRPTTIDGVKRLAKQIKKTQGVTHSRALEFAARSANCASFYHAQRTLPLRRAEHSSRYVLLTIYWSDKKHHRRCGRETLRVELNKPMLELCDKSSLKYARGFGDLRMVAEDHFVCDDNVPSQDYARDRLCKAERSLRFMEHTGLRPYRKQIAYPRILSEDKLPNEDHSTSWIDPNSGQFILADEPYGGAPDEEARVAWTDRTGWRIKKSAWPGMYRPYECDLYIGLDAQSGYDLDALMKKIDNMPAPLVTTNWKGDSVYSWDTFFSPLAKTIRISVERNARV